MSEAVLVGIIAAVASIIGAILTSRATQNKVQEDLKISNEVQNVKIDQLKEEVKKHNNFAERIPVIEEKIKVCNNRIGELERKVG